MATLIGMTAVGATLASVGVALLLEAALLRVILGAVAKAKLRDETRDTSPSDSYRELRTVVH